jgi:hypothetical protein
MVGKYIENEKSALESFFLSCFLDISSEELNQGEHKVSGNFV